MSYKMLVAREHSLTYMKLKIAVNLCKNTVLEFKLIRVDLIHDKIRNTCYGLLSILLVNFPFKNFAGIF
jgi:hypothetical protein